MAQLVNRKRNIYTRFITNHAFIGDGIRLVEHAPTAAPSHVEFWFGDTSDFPVPASEDKHGGWLGAQAPDGVAIRAFDYTKGTWEAWYVTEVDFQQWITWRNFVVSQLGKPYDFRDIAGIALDKDWHNANKWICSEFWTAALLKAGVNVLNVRPACCYRIDPDKAHLSGILCGNMVREFVNGEQTFPSGHPLDVSQPVR